MSAIEEIVKKNGSDITSGYFGGNVSDVAKAVKPSRSKVKQIYGNICVPTIPLNPLNTAAGYRKNKI